VLAAAVSPACQSWCENGDARAAALVAVPRGNWSVLGEAPGQRVGVSAPAEGAVVDPGFCASWAVAVGAGAGAMAIHLHGSARAAPTPRKPPASHRRLASRDELVWAAVVYDASIRRVQLRCASGCSPGYLSSRWREMAEAARQLKRLGRRASR
jgi:hypothetical protein